MRLREALVLFISIPLDSLLIARLSLRLLPSSSAQQALQWLWQLTDPFLQPFFYLFPQPVSKWQVTFEFPTLFAIFIYGFFQYALWQLVKSPKMK